MSVPNQIPESNYVGNGTTTTFAANFEYASDSDVFVTVNGVTPEIGQATFANGVFTFTTAPANGAAVRVYRSTPIERDTEYDNHDNVFRPKVVNTDFDRIWYVLQEYLLSLGIANAKITQEIADRIQADAEMMNYILNEDNELKADYILRDENLKTDYIYRDENLKKYVDQTLGALLELPDFQGIEAQFVKDSSGKNQQEINNALAGVGEKIKREFVSVWDFFTPEQYKTYLSDPPRYDAAPNIQEFFNYISANDVGTAYCSGQFYIYQPLLLGGASGTKTKEIVGFLKVTYYYTAPAIDTVLTIQTGSNCTWSGFINVACNSTNSLNYANRIVKNGIRLGGEYANTHFTIDGLFAENGAKEFGIIVDNNTTGSNIGKQRSSRCGSGYATSGYTPSLYSTFTIDSTNSGSTNQYTILNTANSPDVTANIPLMAEIGGQLYFVLERPNVLGSNKYKVFPSLPSTNAATQLRWVFGGGVYVRGSDASVINIGNISSSTCSVSLHLAALYPPNITSLTTQGNYCGLILGNSLTAGFVGGSLGEIYCEALELNVIQLPRTGVSFPILNHVALNYSKCFNLGNWRLTNDLMSDTYKLGITTLVDSNYTPAQKMLTGTSIAVDMTSFDTQILSKGTDTANRTVNLTMSSGDSLRLFQNYTKTLCIESPSGVYTGTVTFSPPAGVTLNGGTASVAYYGVTLFSIIAYDATTLFIVPLNQKNSVRVTYDPPSLAATGTAGDSVTTTVTLTGATVGTPVQAAFSQYNAAIEIGAQVSAANTVTVKFKNTSASAVDLPSGTLTVKII